MTRRDREGYRTLNAVVPEAIYWLIRRCATESKLSMKGYLAKFCCEAHPFRTGEDDAGASGDRPSAPAGYLGLEARPPTANDTP